MLLNSKNSSKENRVNMLLVNLMSSVDSLEEEMGLVKFVIQKLEQRVADFKENANKIEENLNTLKLTVAKLEGVVSTTTINIENNNDTNIDKISGDATFSQNIKK